MSQGIYKQISISAVGTIHNTHLSKYFKSIFNHNGNILKSKYTSNFNNFLLSADILFPKKINVDFLDAKPNTNSNVFINSTIPTVPFHVLIDKQHKKLIHDPSILKIQTSCSDNCGIIYKHLSTLEDLGGFIYEFSSNVEPAPISSTPLFSMDLIVHFDKNHNEKMTSAIELIKRINKDNNYEISKIK